LQKSGQGWETHNFPDTIGEGYSSFGEDENGEIYLVRRADETRLPGTGAIYHIVEATPY
jgi:hypothetical protein